MFDAREKGFSEGFRSSDWDAEASLVEKHLLHRANCLLFLYEQEFRKQTGRSFYVAVDKVSFLQMVNEERRKGCLTADEFALIVDSALNA